MTTTPTPVDAAFDAAIALAHNAALTLEQQRQGNGLSPTAYRKRIQTIKALTWCAINDLGQAKRMAVLVRRPGMYQRRMLAALVRRDELIEQGKWQANNTARNGGAA